MKPDACLICHGATVRERGVHPKHNLMNMIGCLACGRYFFAIPEGEETIRALNDADRFTLAALARQASDAGAPLELKRETVREVIDAAPRLSLGDRLDRLLLLLAGRAKDYLAPIVVNKDHDFPLVWAAGPNGMNTLHNIAKKKGLLETGPDYLQIMPVGWDRVDALRDRQPNSRQAFVAMWFDKSLDDVWENGLKPGIERSQYYRAVRVSAIQHNDKIDDRIVAEIRRSGLMVADFTGQRAGVYYEAGLARGLGITVIATCREDETGKLHFDTRQYNHIVWTSPADLAQQLHDRISATALPKGWMPSQ